MTALSAGKVALRPVDLSPPAIEGGLSLSAAAARRRTIREIAPTALDARELSSLLWIACGVNRTVGPFGAPGRTAASASNSQEIDVYVLLEEGAYLYNAAAHRLDPVAAGDLRIGAMNRRQPVASRAPVQLVYVVDLDRLTHTVGFDEPGLHDVEVQKSYYFVDTGIIAGHVYLFAATHGLATWFHNCDRAVLSASLSLKAAQRVLFAQSVGWPAKEGATS